MTDLVQAFTTIVESDNQFPVDFDLVWQWIGYSRKDSAKRTLENAGFELGQDFQVIHINVDNSKGGPKERKIMLTIDCFKSFCMMAGTEKGKEVRKYYIEIERRYKETLQRDDGQEYLDEWVEARLTGMDTRRRFSDAMDDWFINNGWDGYDWEARTRERALATNIMYVTTFGMTAKDLEGLLGCGRHESRDYLTKDCLRMIEWAEDHIVLLIDQENMQPSKAAKQYAKSMYCRFMKPKRKVDLPRLIPAEDI